MYVGALSEAQLFHDSSFKWDINEGWTAWILLHKSCSNTGCGPELKWNKIRPTKMFKDIVKRRYCDIVSKKRWEKIVVKENIGQKVVCRKETKTCNQQYRNQSAIQQCILHFTLSAKPIGILATGSKQKWCWNGDVCTLIASIQKTLTKLYFIERRRLPRVASSNLVCSK